MGDVGHGAQPQSLQRLLRAIADTPQGSDRQLVKETDHLGLRHDEQPVRFGKTRCQLCDELGGGHPDRAGDALLISDRVADPLADLTGRTQPASSAGHVEEGLVQRQRLDDRRHAGEDRHDGTGDALVAGVVRSHHRGLRTQPTGPGDGHRRGGIS